MPHRSAPYQVAFSPQAWLQIGQMPHRTFRALQAALDGITQELDAVPKKSGSAGTEGSTTAGGVVITYQRDDATRSLTVLDVRPAPSKP